MNEETLKQLQARARELHAVAQPAADAARLATQHLQRIPAAELKATQLAARELASMRLLTQPLPIMRLLDPKDNPLNGMYADTQRVVFSMMDPMRGIKLPATSLLFKDAVTPFLASIQKQLSWINTNHFAALGSSLGTSNLVTQFTEQLQGPLRQWRELFEQYEEDEQRVLEAIVPLGWLISPSMGMQTIRRLAEALDERPIDEIDSALVGYFSADRCAEIIEGLYDDPTYASYRPLLDEGMDVHRSGNYRAAILVWLAVIDGIAWERFGVRRIFSEIKRRNGQTVRMAIEESSATREALHEALIEVIERTSMKDPNPDPHLPKRDLVMHGRQVDFGNERASIQMILILEVMHYCASPLEPAEPELELLAH